MLHNEIDPWPDLNDQPVAVPLQRGLKPEGYYGDDRDNRSRPTRVPAFRAGITAKALMAMQFAPINYVVPGYVVEGLTLLAGAPKIGKSWMALGMAVAIASGAPAFGSIPVEQGDVLYLALEDNPRRLKRRLLKMGILTPPERLTFCTEWPGLDDGCLDEISAWIAAVERPTMIVVDVLAKVRPDASGKDSAYEADYRTLTGLQMLAGHHRLAVVVVHHTRKMEADDPFDSVSGTRGLTGAADTVLVLKRDSGTPRTILYGRGRDVEEIETAFEFDRDNGTWGIVGAAHEVGRTDERQIILDTLKASEGPLSPQEVSDLTGKSRTAIRQTLTRMASAGEIVKQGYGRYTCHTCHTVTLDGDQEENEPAPPAPSVTQPPSVTASNKAVPLRGGTGVTGVTGVHNPGWADASPDDPDDVDLDA